MAGCDGILAASVGGLDGRDTYHKTCENNAENTRGMFGHS
jgi:hypothetical protein